MEDDSRNWVSLGQKARGARADRPSVQDNIVWRCVEVIRQVQVYCFDIVVKRVVAWHFTVALSEACVLIDNCIDFNMPQEVLVKPVLHQVDVLCVTMGEDHRVLGVLVNVEYLNLTTRFGV